jgi:histone H3/H4
VYKAPNQQKIFNGLRSVHIGRMLSKICPMPTVSDVMRHCYYVQVSKRGNLVDPFENAQFCTVHGKRITVQPKDIKLARRIRGDREDGDRVGSGNTYDNNQSFRKLLVADKNWLNPKAGKRKEVEDKKSKKESTRREPGGSGGRAGKAREGRPLNWAS